jgi:hypothetical protein
VLPALLYERRHARLMCAQRRTSYMAIIWCTLVHADSALCSFVNLLHQQQQQAWQKEQQPFAVQQTAACPYPLNR